MKKIGKILLVSTLTIVTVGTIKVINIDSEALLKGNVSSHVQAYNHNPSNVLDNVYKDENYGLILPFIFDKNGETIKKEYIVEQFNKKGLTPIFSKDVIGTGTTVTVKENNNKYTIVVFGDTNGDGKVNLIDAQKIVLHNKDKSKALTGLYFIAGNVSNKDKVINLIDAQRVVMLQKGLTNKLVVNEPKSIKETDSIAPTVTLTKNNVTTNSIKVTATSKDEQSGMPENPTYTFYLKKTSENDSKYVKKQSGTKSVLELTGLTQNTSYTIKVETTDNLGNIGTKTLAVQTATVTSATNGAIIFGTIEWDSSTHKASVSINTNTNYKVKYQKNSTTGTWIEGKIVTGLSLNDTLYACLSDGTNNGTYTSLKITDPIAPSINLNGDSEITLIVKDEYTELGASATDNVDGNITNNIRVSIKLKPENGEEINVNSVDTNIPGVYTITYSITDTAGNKSLTTRKVIVNDIIDNIEISNNPNKVIYNYGEEIELAGAKIKVNYLSGKSIDNVDISNNMISGYDSKLEGIQEIFVEYEGMQTSFNVKVLKKINGLELIETGRDNITIEDESDVYKTNSKEQFVLGTIKEIEQEEGSKLVNTQVQFITKQQITSSNSNNAEFEETDKLTLSVNENNEIIGTVTEAGSYQIEAFIMYESEKIGITIKLNAVKSTVVGRFLFNGPENDEVRYNNEEPVQKQLKVKNINGEEIGILAKDVIITNNNLDKITITKLNENKSPISLENESSTEVSYLEITTSSKLAVEGVSFKIEIANTDISKDVTFDIGETLGITSIKVNKIENETEVETNSVALGNEIGETILPIYFYNQLDNQMQVKAKDIEIVNSQWLENNTKDDEKLYIVIPDVQIVKTINGLPITTQGSGITAQLYNENGIIANANDNVAKIGFSLLNNQEQKVILSSLTDKYIKFVAAGLNQPHQLSIEVNYNSVTTLNFSDALKQNIEVSNNDECDYIVLQGNDFVLGSISVPVNEELRANMLQGSVSTSSGNTSGMSIYFEESIDGTVLVKGTANQAGIYQIDINLKDNLEVYIDSIYINVEQPINDRIIDIQIGQTYVIGNDETITTINAVSDNSTVQIKRKDIAIKHNNSNTVITNKAIVIEEPENVEIELLDANGTPIPEQGYDDMVISKISIQYTGTVIQNISKTINIILYDNQTPIAKTLNIYASDIKAIDIASGVTLYKTSNSETVQYDELNYSLIDIKGYLDEEKQIKAVLKLSDFGQNGKITVTPDTVLGKVNAGMPNDIELDLVSVQYFDLNKNVISSLETNKEVAYIGFAIKPYVFTAENLNNSKIIVNCATMQLPISITISYTEN